VSSRSLSAKAELCRAAFKLRDAVTSQREARTVVLELTEVHAIEGGGLGMLIYLQRWVRDHGIGLKLLNPSKSVRERLTLVNSLAEFDIPTLEEMVALLACADSQYAIAVYQPRYGILAQQWWVFSKLCPALPNRARKECGCCPLSGACSAAPGEKCELSTG